MPHRFVQGNEHAQALTPTLAPVNSLPSELLQHIFVLCVEQASRNSSSQDFRHSLNLDAPPWSLTRVCRRWHELTSNFPTLWATVVAPPGHLSELQERLMRVQISRSANCPLSLQLGSVNCAEWEPWTDPVSGISQRCRQLDLWDAFLIELPPTLRSFPQLEVLRCPARLIHSRLQPLHEKLPRLRSLSIREHDAGLRSLPLPSFPTPASLTSLTLSEFEYTAVLPLLHSTNSRLCYLHLRDISHKPKRRPRPISFPQLEHLLLHGVPKRVVDAMECPRLEELTVSDHMSHDFWTSPVRFTMTSANLPWSVSMFPTTLVGCIRSLDQLVSLHLNVLESDGAIDSDLYSTEKLFELLSDPTLCPQLARISIGCLPFHPRLLHQLMAFIRLVRSRASTLSYASCSAVYDPFAHYDKGWSGLAVSDGTSAADALKQIMEELRVHYPHLNLHVKLESRRQVVDKLPGERLMKRPVSKQAIKVLGFRPGIYDNNVLYLV